MPLPINGRPQQRLGGCVDHIQRFVARSPQDRVIGGLGVCVGQYLRNRHGVRHRCSPLQVIRRLFASIDTHWRPEPPKIHLRIIVSRQENSLSNRILHLCCAPKAAAWKAIEWRVVTSTRITVARNSIGRNAPLSAAPKTIAARLRAGARRVAGPAHPAVPPWPPGRSGARSHRNMLWWNSFRAMHEELQGRVPG